eukprot:TRINITY_DN8958_c0_g1_i2.p1 TRINITY_DN8958_c0_g1~~TRINITY_DN8958_c0_g1_i2.p1  ORF type:complete len:374 (-),score=60.28 TRINITY_DN8958_c0_g1_i2:109-1158(-)
MCIRDREGEFEESRLTVLNAGKVKQELSVLEMSADQIQPEEVSRRFSILRKLKSVESMSDLMDNFSSVDKTSITTRRTLENQKVRMRIAVKGPGQSFGEDELVLNINRKARVECVSAEGTLYILQQDQAFEVLKDYKTVKELCSYVQNHTKRQVQELAVKTSVREADNLQLAKKQLSLQSLGPKRPEIIESRTKMAKMLHYSERAVKVNRTDTKLPKVQLPNLAHFFLEQNRVAKASKKGLSKSILNSELTKRSNGIVFEMTEPTMIDQLGATNMTAQTAARDKKAKITLYKKLKLDKIVMGGKDFVFSPKRGRTESLSTLRGDEILAINSFTPVIPRQASISVIRKPL